MEQLNPICKKCGGASVSIRWDDGYPSIKDIDIMGFPPSDYVPEECLVITCNRCRFNCIEIPLDKR